jgi:Delta3-Delta2-enoyl-CoA isomerase
MSSVRSSDHDGVVVLHLGRGKANALNAEFLEELWSAVDRLTSGDKPPALVLASELPKVFSAGFDVAEVFAYDRPTMTTFFTRFVRFLEKLRALPLPVIGALGGHAFAGGALLALSTDFRMMSKAANLSVNEVDLAVELPPTMLRSLLGLAAPAVMRSLLLNAEVISAEQAERAGLVRRALDPEQVLPEVIFLARTLGAKPRAAWSAHKRALFDFPICPEAEITATIDVWFSPEAESCRRALTARLASRS